MMHIWGAIKIIKKTPFVSIIILNWNGKEITCKCLDTLLNKTEYKKTCFRVILVDNGSTDGSAEFFEKKYGDKIDLIKSNVNLGFINGNNMGINYAIEKFNPSFVLLLNNDIEIIQKDWLQKLVETALKNERIGLVGPKLIFPNGRIQWCGGELKKILFF